MGGGDAAGARWSDRALGGSSVSAGGASDSPEWWPTYFVVGEGDDRCQMLGSQDIVSATFTEHGVLPGNGRDGVRIVLRPSCILRMMMSSEADRHQRPITAVDVSTGIY